MNEQLGFDIGAVCRHKFNIPSESFVGRMKTPEIEVPCSYCGLKKKMVTWYGVEMREEQSFRRFQSKGGTNRALGYK